MLQPGQLLRNRYHILGFLGRGGMADVYLALDARRQARVAIKVMREDLAEDPAFLRRFAREAQALARLDHPNIVRFYSFERQGPLAFIVMDYVEGVTLRRLLMERGGPLSLQEATSILQQVGSALHYAHAEGFIHRDLKPGNIMISREGRVYLSDFGIARAVDSVTVTTLAAGTPAYMSPEQILGAPLDHRTDIYSLGVVLFQMVTGQRPFTGEEASSRGEDLSQRVRDAHLHAPPPDPCRLNPDLPPAASQIILKALAKQPDQRWPDVMSMVRAWERTVDMSAGAPMPIPIPTKWIETPQGLLTSTPPGKRKPLFWGKTLTQSSPASTAGRRSRWPVWISMSFILVMGLIAVMLLLQGQNRRAIVSEARMATTTPFSTQPVSTFPSAANGNNENVMTIPPVSSISPTSLLAATPTPLPTPTITPSPSPTSTPVASHLYIEYLIDASNGMMRPWRDGSEPKLASIQRVLPVHWQYVAPKAHVGLRAYGHHYLATDAQSCADVELLLSPGQQSAQELTDKLFQIKARGMDSMARALGEAFGDFTFSSDRINALILITDGGDTCGGDPLQVFQTYREAGVTLPTYIIALEPDVEQKNLLKQIAQLSHGRYYEAHNAQQVYDALGKAIKIISTSLP